jgi:hypothetical protein
MYHIPFLTDFQLANILSTYFEHPYVIILC